MEARGNPREVEDLVQEHLLHALVKPAPEKMRGKILIRKPPNDHLESLADKGLDKDKPHRSLARKKEEKETIISPHSGCTTKSSGMRAGCLKALRIDVHCQMNGKLGEGTAVSA